MKKQKKVKCLLCPKECILSEYEHSNCRGRINIDGELKTLNYGYACSVNIDPIEKKPLFHFLPGTRIFSIATAGCNLHCKFCQNWQISQFSPEEVRYTEMLPDVVVNEALSLNCPSIAYTYSEPIAYYEYTLDTSRIAKEKGIRNVLVTAGYINEAPLKELIKVIDATNTDLKAFSDDYYREICDGTLEPVLKGLEIMRDEGLWIEITNLILPTLNDSDDDIIKLCRWIVGNLGKDIPVHFSRFYPMYKLTNLPPTPTSTLDRARDIAISEGVMFAYVGNIPGHPGENTYCPKCKTLLIERQIYFIRQNNIIDGKCPNCGFDISGVWK
ncbi:MAG: AmmeMemoRadiSam system radical SAM enzyme [bacterium]